jgi:hypothetical protein
MDLDAIVSLIPAKFLPYALAAWALLFYVVAPLVKRFGKPGSVYVRAAEWISQDTHRPPAAGKAPVAVLGPKP